MIAPSRSAAYRRFYLYSALSIAVIACAIAATLLLRIALLAATGLPVPADETSRNVALAVALFAIGVPVGGAHLWAIVRSLRDPGERSAGLRHQFLNLWVAFALLVILFAGEGAFSAQFPIAGTDVTFQASIAAIAAIVAAIAARWISRTPPVSSQPRIRGAVVVMLVAMATAAFAVASAAGGAGGIWLNASLPLTPIDANRLDPNLRGPSYHEGAFGTGLLTAGLALTIWSIGFSWQRRLTESRDRLGYALLGYGIGMLALLTGTALSINGGIAFARDPRQLSLFTSTWPVTAVGALLVAVHATVLLSDRGRNGHPPVTTTRLLLAFPSLVGVGLLVSGLSLVWHSFLERDVVTATRLTDDVVLGAALAAIGLAASFPAWRAFDARTTAGSAVRRFYLFTVVCLALVGGLISGVLILYYAITAIARVGERDAPLTALSWILPAVLLGAIFAAHLVLLLRDQRRTRATETAAPDTLVALLEDVRTGRVSVDDAAAKLRAPGA